MKDHHPSGDQSEIISGIWVGERVIPLAHACMNSFLSMGHRYELYTYNDVGDVPAGVIIKDANRIISRDQVFWAHGGWETFTERFAYQFLKLNGGWCVDSGDVVCASHVLPGSELVFAEEKPGLINNAVLRFPKQHFAILKLIDYVNTVDSVTAKWGATGPFALSAVFNEAGIGQYKSSPSLIYPIHWKEAPKLLFPEYFDEIKIRTEGSPFIHLWGSTLRAIGFHNEMRPLKGSYIDELYMKHLNPIIYNRLTHADESDFRAEVEKCVSREWGEEITLTNR